MTKLAQLESALSSMSDDAFDKIEIFRQRYGFEDKDPEFAHAVKSYLGDDFYDFYIVWCEDGDQ